MREKVTLDHPIFTRWPAQCADRLQLFSAPTPNGVKVGIMLEETSLAYEPHRIDIMEDENHDPAFVALNPNGAGSSAWMRAGLACRRALFMCRRGSTVASRGRRCGGLQVTAV
jgi:hypothetical protein